MSGTIDNDGQYVRMDGIYDRALRATVYTYRSVQRNIVGFVFANEERTKAVLVYFEVLPATKKGVVIRVHRTTTSFVDDDQQFGGVRLDAPIDLDADPVIENLEITRDFLDF